KENYDVIRIQTPNYFAWITGGQRNYVDITSDWTGVVLYITQEKVIASVANNEAERFKNEELINFPFIEIRKYDWWKQADDVVKDILTGKQIAGDMNLPGIINVEASLRNLFYPLLPEEISRYDMLGKEVSSLFFELANKINSGMSEYQISGMWDGLLISKGIVPMVTMVAADERAKKYKHPLPTNNIFNKYVIISTCAYRGGLVISQTRSISVGKTSEDIQSDHYNSSYIAAQLIKSSCKNTTYEKLFDKTVLLYKEIGQKNDWKKHNFGGVTGYRTRELSISPNSKGTIQTGIALAWNPTVGFSKSEDTIVINENDSIVLSDDSTWPQLTFNIGGFNITRPEILII